MIGGEFGINKEASKSGNLQIQRIEPRGTMQQQKE
jgi:hypothetical protein